MRKITTLRSFFEYFCTPASCFSEKGCSRPLHRPGDDALPVTKNTIASVVLRSAEDYSKTLEGYHSDKYNFFVIKLSTAALLMICKTT